MKIKKIKARNFSEALTLVKKELGTDAVILSSDDMKGGGSYVEVTAAVDYDNGVSNNSYSFQKAEVTAVSENYPEPSTGPAVSGLAEIRLELEGLRKSINAMKENGFELKLPEERKKMFYYLKERTIKDEFAFRLVERASEIEELEEIMSNDISVAAPSNDTVPDSVKILTGKGSRVVMLVGPTGVGKTTTVAKLASNAIKEGKKVAMISLDTFKIGAAEQIRIYSRMIGIPLDIVSHVKNLKDSVNKFSDRDLILIDTTGHNPRNRDYIDGLKDVYSTGLTIETQLLLSTSSDSDFLMNTHEHYKSLPIDYLAFTKTDEAVKLGSIYNICRVYEKPVAYITTGQGVPGNIEFADSRKLTNLILKTGSA
jgi:flagellar biosynthesis protein FlhF